MKIKSSIQKRVFLIFGSFTLFLTLVYTGINILVAYIIEDDVLEKILAHEVHFIENSYQQEGKIIQPRVDYMKLYLKPELAPKEIAEAYKNKTLTSEVFTQDKVHYHIQFIYFNEKSSGLLVAEVTPFLTVSNASNSILVVFVIVFIIALILSLWLAYRIAKRTTQPISILANEVMLQLEKKESIYFSARQSNDEIGFLAYTIEKVMTGLKDSVKRESEFNRDVSHELRTPLTVLNNTLALSENRTLSALDIKQLNNSAKQMSHIVTSLLTLARAESVEFEVLFLRSLLEDCILSLHHKLGKKKLNVRLDIASDFELKTNKQLVILLVNNLLENAIEYASETELTISLKDNLLLFKNKIHQQVNRLPTDRLTDRSVKQSNSPGLGQGLYLVRRIIETLGWNFEIQSDYYVFTFCIDLNDTASK
jgi:signal transduction histidine kinase